MAVKRGDSQAAPPHLEGCLKPSLCPPNSQDPASPHTSLHVALSGASIVRSGSSETYGTRTEWSAHFTLLGIPLWRYFHSPRVILQVGLNKGPPALLSMCHLPPSSMGAGPSRQRGPTIGICSICCLLSADLSCAHSQMSTLATAGHSGAPGALSWCACLHRSSSLPSLWSTCPKPCPQTATSPVPPRTLSSW